ncbi:hypothetical protein ACIBI8_36360 [Streptomyces sp. NPDC050529]|uniref:hypothetical protein n=1 Tax=unclassified Streptomyces TaxID=2593676 RepID=UPI002DDC81E8|nr:hypothetical protein [Streptomyces sp. NBC_01022]WRZ78820.1 hypothetical protein OG316_00325 [Streptomyces sp. NBC_01022]WRZ86859.1 hypothetical protein OG316_44570 [Streptomyces sp. NBC_01022]
MKRLFLTHRPPAAAAHAAAAGAATGLVTGALVLGAQQMGGVLGMPGAAVRYVLLTGALLALAGPPLTRRLVIRFGGRPRGAARCALAACLLAVLAGAVPHVAVFCGAVLPAAPLGAVAFRLRTHGAWYPAALAGFAASGAAVWLLPDRPESALLLCAAAGALVLAPMALSRAVPEPVPEAAQSLLAKGSGTARSAYAAAGFAAGAGALATQDFLTFRFELLGAQQAMYVAAAAAGAALLFLLYRLPSDGVSAADARRAAATLLAGAGAALLALATAAGPHRLAVSFGALLCCVALAGRLLDRAFTGRRLDTDAGWVMLGALAGIGTLSGLRGALDAGDALVLCALPPLLGTLLLTRTAGEPATEAAPAELLLRVQDLTVRRGGRTEIRRLRLAAAPGDILVLRDERSGRRAVALLRALAGLDRPAAGRVRLHGQDVRRMDPRSRWLLGLSAVVDPVNATGAGVLPQLASDRTVGEALRAAAERHGPARAEELTQSARAAFPALDDRLDDAPAGLEPAERGVLGLAQTLLARPRLLLLDLTAPTAASLADDPQLAALVRRIAGQGTVVLVATSGSAATLLGGRPIDLTERRPARAVRSRRRPAATDAPRSGPAAADGTASHERNPA